ncbi:unnamed protein product, partial [Mesorhabditis belari]|uniref:Uncharacterized protein n=1 Tax=Mesorhabditis belari TaxID=2138241 RepID=A0AAF3FHL6_9BILA
MARNKYYRKPKFGSKEYFITKIQKFRRNKGRSSAYAMIMYGVILNVIGTGLGLIKASLDRDVIQSQIEQNFAAAGIKLNKTSEDGVTPNNDGGDGGTVIVDAGPSPVLLVFVTMFGRMCNVVGTIKIFKGIERLISNRRKKKLKETTERLKNGETQAEATEMLADCCQGCVF